MKKTTVTFAIGLIAWLGCTAAFSAYEQHPPGVPIRQEKSWPAGLADLLNSGGRVYGFWGFAYDAFFYAGDDEDFNEFVKRYAELKDTPLTLVLHSGQGRTRIPGKTIQFDWEVKARRGWRPVAPGDPGKAKPGYIVTAEAWLGGGLKLDELSVPLNVEVRSAEKKEEFAKFVAAQEARRKQSENTDDKNHPDPPVIVKSDKPLYAKVGLNEGGSKVLSVMYDESKGTGKGYDLLYADVNFNAKFEQGESVRKTLHPYMSRTRAIPAGWKGWAFSPVSVNVPFNEKGDGVPDPCKITLRYQKYPTMRRVLALGTIGPSTSPRKMVEIFEVRSEIRLRQDSAVWEYSFEGSMKPSESLESAAVWRFDDKPKIEIATRPDGRKAGNLGIALSVPAGERRFECRKAGQPPKAHVHIKKPDGTVVHKGDETLDKFRFG
jgi:hypothetical protein